MSNTVIKTDELLKVLSYMNMLNLRGMLRTPTPLSDGELTLDHIGGDVYTLEEIIHQLEHNPSDVVMELQETIERLQEENQELVRKNNALTCSVILLS